MKRAQGPYLQRLDAVLHVVYGTGRGGKVEDVLHPPRVERPANVLLDEFKAGLVLQVSKIASATGDVVVHRDHLVALAQQGVTKVGTDETRASGHQHTHECPPIRACILHTCKWSPFY